MVLRVAEVVDTPQDAAEPVAEKFILQNPSTSQSPAVRLIEVILVCTVVAREMEVAWDADTYSPIEPEFALLLVVVPTIPASWAIVRAPVSVPPLKGRKDPVTTG